MTLKYMQGFETMRDNSDMAAQGWSQQSTKITCGFPTSITAVNGTSLKLISPYSSQSVVPGVAGEISPGYFNTGITVNQAWLAGGFTFGFGARFNSGVFAAYGSGNVVANSSVNNAQACFDGTRYWAIRVVGSTYNVAYSTDLVNWTIAPAQPTAMDSFASISYVGANTVAVIRSTTATANFVVYYSSNQGSSWSSYTVGAWSVGGSAPSNGVAAATGNATYPHVAIGYSAVSNSGSSQLYVGTLGTSMALVKSIAGNSSGFFSNNAQIKNIGGLICVMAGMNGACQMHTATASNPALNTAAAWSTMVSSTSIPVFADVTYHAPSNLWVFATVQGMYTLANTGASGTPVAPSGTVTLAQRYSTVPMTNVYVVGTTLIAVGNQGHIITSPDGVTWTESGGHILPVGVSGSDWRAVVYDGSQYVLFSDAGTGVIAVTPDLQTNYAAKYVMENVEQPNATNNLGRLGIITASGAPAGTGYFTAGIYFSTFYVLAASGGNRTIQLGVQGVATYDSNFSVSTTPLYHFYEIVGRAGATANTFFYDIYVDGVKTTTGTTARPLAGPTDTTMLMLLSLDRYGAFVAYDDMYVTLNDGIANTLQGPLGIVNIVAQRPTADVQAQWVKTGGGTTNASAVNQSALSSTSAQYVTSQNSGDKDIYSSSSGIPAGFSAKAQMAEAYFTRTSTTAPVVNVGIQSGSAEADGPNITVNSASTVYTAIVSDVNPNGNTPWNNSSINASNFVINHVT